MSKQTIITILLALVAMAGQGQSSFDAGEGCSGKQCKHHFPLA